MADKKAVGGLKWVKGEIGATLRPVRDLVETGGSNSTVSDMNAVTQALEQVYGVLVALQLSAPARLVEEMNRLAERMSESEDPEAYQRATQVMGQALSQVLGHLDRLDAGFDDPPLSLWAIINEVRAACDDMPLSTSELLTFAAVNTEGDSQWMPEELDILSEVMRQVRPQFHRHLVDWYRGDPENDGLAQLNSLFHQLHDYLKEGLLADLFRLTELVSTSLINGDLDITPDSRSLLGHLDWVLKPLVQRPPHWPEVDALTLIEQYLDALTEARVDSPLIEQLRASYGPIKSDRSYQPTDSVSLVGEEAIAELAISVLGEFSALKEQFDLIARGELSDRSAIDDFCSHLRRLGEALDVAEVGNLPTRMRALADNFSELSPEDVEKDVERLESFAMELLGIEAVLLAHADHRTLKDDEILAPEMDLAELSSATLREAGFELVRVKEAISSSQTEGDAPTALAPVQDCMFRVSGALRILGENGAADLAEIIAETVDRRFVRDRRPLTEKEFEHLADAVAALELYVGHLQEPTPFGDELIGRADRSIAALEASAVEEASTHHVEFLPEDGDDASAYASVGPTSELLSSAGDSFGGEDAETAFLDIFLEEAREEMASAQTQFARWESNPHDQEALKTLRRSFHTLKGSGRLVGAMRCGDFAQSVEFLLNKVIEKELFPSEDVLACVAEAVRQLPDLIDAEAEGRPFDVTPMVTRADGLRAVIDKGPAADGEPPAPEAPAVPAEPDQTEAAIEGIVDRDSQFAADEELLRIFQGETYEHLSALRDFLERADGGEGIADEPLQRALHTLTGSARMAGIDSIARVTKALELAVKPAVGGNQRLEEPMLSLLRRTADAVKARVDELPGLGEGAAALAALATEVADLPEPPEESLPPEILDEELEPASEEAPADLASDDVSLEVKEDDQPDVQEAQTAEDSAGPEQQTAPEEAHAASEAEAEAEAEAAEAMSAPDAEMAGIFLEDARDLIDNLDSQFRDWHAEPSNTSAIDGINRLLHTLKGNARLTGLSVIGDLSHALESRLKAISDSAETPSSATLELTQKTVDSIAAQIEALAQGEPIPRMADLVEALGGISEDDSAPELEAEAAAPVAPVAEGPTEIAEDKAPTEEASAPQAKPGLTKETAALAARFLAGDRAPARPEQREPAGTAAPQIRVRSDLLNRLVNHAGEISIYRGRLTQRNGQLGFGLGELDQTVIRLREQLRQLEIETQTQILHRFERSGAVSDYDKEFDPLEFDRFSRLQQLSGSLAETVNDLVSVKEMLGGYQREMTNMLNQQARLADDLQDGLLRTRLVPFVQVVPRLHRLVRQTADSLGKSARLEVIGPEVELDRTILDRLVAPLEHLLRNAVDHGLEDSKARVAKGKSATGKVTLALHREGNDAVISLSDDGKGLDLEAIRKQAITRGLMVADAKLPDEAVLQFILEPGFTTSGKVTQISGRGVGLDVVASEIKAANGTISLESVPGKGAKFVIRLPLTLAIIEAFLVSVGEGIYAVPHSTVEGAARIGHDELKAIYQGEGKDFTIRGHSYKVMYMGTALDPRQEPEVGERRWLPMLLVRLGEQRVALHVDSLIESQRILVKPLGQQLTGVRWLSGGTILPDGRVALILDALALLRSGTVQEHQPVVEKEEEAAHPTTIMVVDDSLTVRRVTSRLLRRQHMEVLTAKDGVEALTLLDEHSPDLILLDVEMPRMDGYELTRHIRRSDRLKHLPIIMITSRTGQKHRDYAMQLGVDRYLGKPYQESELMLEINSLLEEKGVVRVTP